MPTSFTNNINYIMKYIAIVSYGHDDEIVVSFVSPITGTIDKTIEFDGFDDWGAMERVRDYELIGEPAVIYDHCSKQRYEIGERIDLRRGSWYVTEEKRMGDGMYQEEGWERAIMLSAEKVGSYMCEHWDETQPPFKCYIWKITAQRGTYNYHYEWREERDSFYKRFKEEYGLELPFEARQKMGINKCVELVAEKYGIEIINIINQ